MGFKRNTKTRKSNVLLPRPHANHPLRYGHALNRLKPIFDAASSSFTETIRPNAQNAALIKTARDELGKLAQGQEYMSVHIRRGDKPPISWKYQGKHIPISQFAEAVDDTSKRLTGSLMPLYIATDSPSAEDELIKSIQTDTTVLSLRLSQRPELQALASPKEYIQHEFNHLKEHERIKLTRGMIVDFAMLSGMWTWDGDVSPRATVCTIRYVYPGLPYSFVTKPMSGIAPIYVSFLRLD